MTSRPAKITTPIPTIDELGKRLGVSRTRQREIISIVRGEKSESKIRFRKSATTNAASGKRVSKRS